LWLCGQASAGPEQIQKGCFNVPGLLTNENGVTTPPCCCIDKLEVAIPPEEPNDPLFLKMVIDSVVESFEKESRTITTTTTNPTTTSSVDGEASSTTSSTATTVSIDRSRVYMAGHSNGCIASLAMAALYSDVVAAVCCHAGTLLTPFPSEDDDDNTYMPVPVWMAHGMKDTVIPYEGVTYMDFAPFGSIGFWSSQDSMNYIAKKNECQNQEEEYYYDDPAAAENNNDNNNGPDNNTRNIMTTYKRTNCTNNADVELVVLPEAGHVPYSMTNTEGSGMDNDLTIDTTALAWDFCSSYQNSYQQELQLQQQQQPKVQEEIETNDDTTAATSTTSNNSIDDNDNNATNNEENEETEKGLQEEGPLIANSMDSTKSSAASNPAFDWKRQMMMMLLLGVGNAALVALCISY